MQRIFTVVERFEIAGKGLALIGATDVDSLSIRIRNGSRVTIKRPGMADIETHALGFELRKNSYSDKIDFIAILIPYDVGLENVPPKSEVWSDA